MIDTPQVTQSPAQKAAVIHLTVPREDLPEVMGPGIQELMSVVKGQGVKPAGPWFAHYLRMKPQAWEFEIGVPITESIKPEGRVTAGQLPGATVARTVFYGNYEGLYSAWREFDTWVQGQGYTPAPDLWERYVVGPESTSNPAEWRTELNRPLAGGA
jgi:effector-binding domain-containing protein